MPKDDASDKTWHLYTQEIHTMDTCLFHMGPAPQEEFAL
jgi:hypothetical protein